MPHIWDGHVNACVCVRAHAGVRAHVCENNKNIKRTKF